MRSRDKLALVMDMLGACFPRRRGGDPARILVVRLDGFGDFSLYLPFALALRELYPRGCCHLALLGNSMWCDAARTLLPFDDFISLEVGRYMTELTYRSDVNRTLSRGGYGTVLQPRFFREPFLEDRLALAAGAASGTAFTVGKTHLQRRWGSFLELRLYDRLVGGASSEHEARKNRAFFDALGVYREVPRPELPPPPSPWRKGEYLVLLPGSGKGRRACWQEERWGMALEDCGLKCAVVGSKAESALVNAASRAVGEKAVPLAGTLNIMEFCGLLAHAACVVGNDTGGIHFAAWCGVPALAVAGGGHPGWYYPYPDGTMPLYVRKPHYVTADSPCGGCSWRCTKSMKGVFPCIADVAVETVKHALTEMLSAL